MPRKRKKKIDWNSEEIEVGIKQSIEYALKQLEEEISFDCFYNYVLPAAGLYPEDVNEEKELENFRKRFYPALLNALKPLSKKRKKRKKEIETKIEIETEIENKTETEIKNKTEAGTETETKTEIETETKNDIETESKVETEIEVEFETKAEFETKNKIETETEIEGQSSSQSQPQSSEVKTTRRRGRKRKKIDASALSLFGR